MEKEIFEKVSYIAEQTSKLCEISIGHTLPISSLTIFSHDEDEFENLKASLTKLGSPYNENNGPRVTLHKPIKVGNNEITHLRIRKPDSERPQVGCNDFDVEDYFSFKEKYLTPDSKNLRLIVRSDYEMIEFFDDNFDVLAYIVSK